MSYDVKCGRLADDFLDGTARDWSLTDESRRAFMEKHSGALAQQIQDALEDYLRDAETELQPARAAFGEEEPT